jgi:hypothetical protein
MDTFQLRYHPHCKMTVDKAMIPFKGWHDIKQYMKEKPTKWKFKVWVLACPDAMTDSEKCNRRGHTT